MNKFKVNDLVKIKDPKVIAMLGNLEPKNLEAFKKQLTVSFVSTLFSGDERLTIYRCVPTDENQFFAPLNDYSFEEDLKASPKTVAIINRV
jgi:hypothetical protein